MYTPLQRLQCWMRRGHGRRGQRKEQRILTVMHKVLGQVIRDTTTPPGMRQPLFVHPEHPQSKCLALIAVREAELVDALGEPRGE